MKVFGGAAVRATRGAWAWGLAGAMPWLLFVAGSLGMSRRLPNHDEAKVIACAFLGFALLGAALGAVIGAAAGSATIPGRALAAIVPSDFFLSHPTLMAKSCALLTFAFAATQGYVVAGFKLFTDAEIMKVYVTYTVLPCLAIVALFTTLSGGSTTRDTLDHDVSFFRC